MSDVDLAVKRGMLGWLLMAFGVVLIIIMVAAGSFGVDTDQKWGPLRIGILLVGLLCFALAFGWQVAGAIDERSKRSTGQTGAGQPSHIDQKAHFSSPAWIVLAVVFAVIVLVYVWLVSGGYMTNWPETAHFYDLLAEGFLQGQTSLPIEPSPELISLPDPYSPIARRGVPHIGDAVFFGGRYYMYWGPAPAAILAAWKLVTRQTVGDQYVVFISVTGTFLFATLILGYFRRNYYPRLPAWLMAASMVFVGTAHPMMWVLNSPTVHRGAIASGQTFLMAGLLLALPILDKSRIQVWRLGLASLLWVFAIGARATLLGPVAVLTVATVFQALSARKNRRAPRVMAKNLLAIGLPLIFGLAILGLYNYARFGSFVETGFRFQLARDNNDLIVSGNLFNPAYLVPNSLHYALAPFRYRDAFPFIRPNFDDVLPLSQLFDRLTIPDTYHLQNVNGLIFATPIIAFAVYAVVAMISGQVLLYPKASDLLSDGALLNRHRNLTRVITILVVASIIAALPPLLYFWVADRFMLDAVPLVTLVAAVGAWHLFRSTGNQPARRSLAKVLILVLAITSALIGFLLAFTGSGSRMDDINPDLYVTIVEFFSK